MKKFLALLLMLAMLVSPAFAIVFVVDGETVTSAVSSTSVYDYDELVVGTVMPMYGAFSMDNWGNASSDVDVRKLIHGYNLVEWNTEKGGFRLDPSVVAEGSVVLRDEEGNHIYSITLYEDMYYSDGTPITAWDYAFSWLLRTSPLIDEIGGKSLHTDYISGWKEYAEGKTPCLAGLRVIGKYQLQIRIRAEYLPYFYEAGLLDCYPYPIHVIAPECEVRDDGQGAYIRNREDPEAEPLFTAELLKRTLLDEENGYLSHPAVVSGAYRMLSFDGTEASFELNPYYKGNADGLKPVIPRIVFRVANADTMVDELMRGEYGLLNKVSRADVIRDGAARAAGSAEYTQSTYPRQGLSFITFNGTRPATADAAVRKAVALCLDKDTLTRDYVGEYGIKVDGYYGLGQWMYQIASGTLTLEPDEALPEEEQEKIREEWKGITLEGLETYEFDPARAAKLLNEAGWTLNRAGEAYDSGRDDVRCREIDGELVPLELKLVYPESTQIAEGFETCFAAPLKEAGILLTLEASSSVLPMYYGQEEPDYDMLFLGTNFVVAFDPASLFMEDGAVNVNGVKDEALAEAALDMRRTEPGDLLTYSRKWIEFQARFAEAEPMIPVYSNVYYDFYPQVLRNYHITQSITWSEAIVGSYFSDVPEEMETTEAAAEGEDAVEGEDAAETE